MSEGALYSRKEGGGVVYYSMENKKPITIQSFANHSLDYAKALVRVQIYRLIEWMFGGVGSFVATLLVLSLVPFFLGALLLAGAFAIQAWLDVSIALAFLIIAGGVWVLMMLLLLFHGVIARSVRDKQYRAVEPLLNDLDDALTSRDVEEGRSEVNG